MNFPFSFNSFRNFIIDSLLAIVLSFPFYVTSSMGVEISVGSSILCLAIVFFLFLFRLQWIHVENFVSVFKDQNFLVRKVPVILFSSLIYFTSISLAVPGIHEYGLTFSLKNAIVTLYSLFILILMCTSLVWSFEKICRNLRVIPTSMLLFLLFFLGLLDLFALRRLPQYLNEIIFIKEILFPYISIVLIEFFIISQLLILHNMTQLYFLSKTLITVLVFTSHILPKVNSPKDLLIFVVMTILFVFMIRKLMKVIIQEEFSQKITLYIRKVFPIIFIIVIPLILFMLGFKPCITVTNSMIPIINPGDLVIIIHKSSPFYNLLCDIGIGSIIVRSLGNVLVAHRVYDLKGYLIYTKGDNNIVLDPPITINDVKGCVVFVLKIMEIEKLILGITIFACVILLRILYKQLKKH